MTFRETANVSGEGVPSIFDPVLLLSVAFSYSFEASSFVATLAKWTTPSCSIERFESSESRGILTENTVSLSLSDGLLNVANTFVTA